MNGNNKSQEKPFENVGPSEKSGQFIINPYLNLRPFFGGIPLLFTTIWGDQPAGKVVINWPEKYLQAYPS